MSTPDSLGQPCRQESWKQAGQGGRKDPVSSVNVNQGLRARAFPPGCSPMVGQQRASATSGSPTMSLCTSLKVSMKSSVHCRRSPPVANLARSAV